MSFTGSTGVGARVGELAGRSIKKVALELGGKSANVILDGADVATAVKVGVGNAFLNGGQTCMAWTRMLVPHKHYGEALEQIETAVSRYTAGDPPGIPPPASVHPPRALSSTPCAASSSAPPTRALGC